MPRPHLVSLQTQSAPALVTGDLRVVPEFQVLRVRVPFGGLVWSQPTAVIVESEVKGEGRRLAISKGASPLMMTVEKSGEAPRPGTVYSAPVTSGEYTIITASDVLAGRGFSHGRPVATIIIGPDGVKIQPVVDATRVVLGVMAVIGAGVLAARLRSRKLQK
jgi:hypothetical protein